MTFLEARNKAGLTQMQVASEIGVTEAAVSMWESGTNKPRADTLIKLSALYGVTIDELLKEE